MRQWAVLFVELSIQLNWLSHKQLKKCFVPQTLKVQCLGLFLVLKNSLYFFSVVKGMLQILFTVTAEELSILIILLTFYCLELFVVKFELQYNSYFIICNMTLSQVELPLKILINVVIDTSTLEILIRF